MRASPDVQELVEAAAATSKSGLSGEQMLEGLGTLLDIVGIDGRIMTVGNYVGPALGALGINMSKMHAESFTMAPGLVLATSLAFFAAEGMSVSAATQLQDGCIIRTSLPTNLWTWKGATLLTTFEIDGEHVKVQAVTHLVGQTYDLGYSTRLFSRYFGALHACEKGYLSEDVAASTSQESAPSALPTGGAPVAGWYRDVERPSGQRWWDGAKWTEHRHP